jgi:hypothetical protein
MNPYLRFGAGTDALALTALGLAIASSLAFALWRPTIDFSARKRFVWLAALSLAAALLSAGYVVHYLRGGPRIVDAAYYFLEGRALSNGFLAFPVPEPLASFNGRFLVANAEGRLGVLFPPGYPAALAIAFRLGAPLALGPVVAALLIPASYRLARELGLSEPAAIGSAAIGVACAALRYHTADTMSHGWSALLLTSALAAALRGSPRALAFAGLCVGWLVATRPFTGAVGALGVAWLARTSGKRAAWIAPGLLPGLALLLLHQHAVTGHWLGSTQRAYYAVADGPPGCFRYGFGTGVGCLFEHGDFVRARLASGYGLLEATRNTLLRLAFHTFDIANLAPLAALVPLAAWRARREPRVLGVAALVPGVMLAYAPFYFDGSYPGGGVRFFADVLPIEHVLLARGLSALGIFRWVWPATLAGFALHTHHQHDQLRERDGGRPMFERSVLDAAGVTHGLVFLSTDHGFAIGHDPAQHDARTSIVIARRRNDLLDRLLWDELGRPPAYTYDFDPREPGTVPSVRPLTLEVWSATRVEGENLWPALRVESGWVHPTFSSRACASRGRGLKIRRTGLTTMPGQHPDRPTDPSSRIVLTFPRTAGLRSGRFGWIGARPPDLRVVSSKAGPALVWQADGEGCWRSNSVGLEPEAPTLELHVRDEGVLDYVELSR